MLTRVQETSDIAVQVSSIDEDIKVAVSRPAKKATAAPLSRAETHDALVKAKKKAEHFIAAVEGDIEATED